MLLIRQGGRHSLYPVCGFRSLPLLDEQTMVSTRPYFPPLMMCLLYDKTVGEGWNWNVVNYGWKTGLKVGWLGSQSLFLALWSRTFSSKLN